MSPGGPPTVWPACFGSHHNVRVHSGQMEQKEKWSILSIMKRGEMEESSVESSGHRGPRGCPKAGHTWPNFLLGVKLWRVGPISHYWQHLRNLALNSA